MTNQPIIDKQSSVPYTQTQEGISADAQQLLTQAVQSA